MDIHGEKIMALFTIAHCVLKSAYIVQDKQIDENAIRKEVTNIYDTYYADSDKFLSWLREEGTSRAEL